MTLSPGEYSIVITGPKGLILEGAIDLRAREHTRLALDDAHLSELLIVTSIVGGAVEAELHIAHKAAQEASGKGGPTA